MEDQTRIQYTTAQTHNRNFGWSCFCIGTWVQDYKQRASLHLLVSSYSSYFSYSNSLLLVHLRFALCFIGLCCTVPSHGYSLIYPNLLFSSIPHSTPLFLILPYSQPSYPPVPPLTSFPLSFPPLLHPLFPPYINCASSRLTVPSFPLLLNLILPFPQTLHFLLPLPLSSHPIFPPLPPLIPSSLIPRFSLLHFQLPSPLFLPLSRPPSTPPFLTHPISSATSLDPCSPSLSP